MHPFPSLKQTTLGIAAAFLFFGTVHSHAATVITVLNDSFEEPVVGGGPGGVPDWSGGFVRANNGYLDTTYGTHYTYFYNAATYGSPLAWSASQQSSYVVQAGDVFNLTVAIGNDSGSNGPNLTSFYTGLIQLTVDGVTVASFTGDSTPTLSGGFIDVSFQYTAPAGDAGKLIGIRLGDITGANSGGYYDNVRLSVDPAAIPELGTTALLGIGAVTAIALARRQRRQLK